MSEQASKDSVAPADSAAKGKARWRAWPRRSTEQAAVAVMLTWGLLTVAELLTAIHPWVSWSLALLQTLALPVFSVTVVAMIKSEQPLAARGRDEEQAIAAQRRSYIVHAVVLVLLAACVAAKAMVLLEVSERSVTPGLSASYRNYAVTAFALVIVGMFGSPRRLSRFVASVAHRPARLMVFSFGLAAMLGALLLALPVSLVRLEHASLVDALFNAVSAVCVTGLSVRNVAETYSPFGQVVILVLMQVGGLGIMLLSSFFAILAGGRLHARSASVMAELLDVGSLASLRKNVFRIVAFTLAVELLGAVLLFAAFGAHPDMALSASDSSAPLAGAGSRLWAALFTAVSAFCNAGFTVFRAGTEPLVEDTFASFVIMALIVVGGLGFPVVFELARRAERSLNDKRNVRLSLHSRVVLVTTAALLLIGAVMFLLLEYDRALAHLDFGDQLVAALFQSVTCRTAGFNTVDFSIMGPGMLFVAACLMVVGASPGSTGGGVKTTTVAVLWATFRAEMSRSTATLGGRSVPPDTVRRAMSIIVMGAVVFAVSLFALLVTQQHSPVQIAFEAVSAFSTTGLSTGITSELNAVGKLVIAAMMFMGRIGPLTLAVALAAGRRKPRYRLAEEHIGIG